MLDRGDMVKHLLSPSWLEPGWFEEAAHWIDIQLNQISISITGPITQPHVRPWSTVLKIPTNVGDIYFKAVTPSLGHEPVLTQALSHWRPDIMPKVIGIDVKRGWMLTRDMGIQLRSLMVSKGDAARWKPIMKLYAELQIEMVERHVELLSLGALDRRLSLLPGMFAHVLEDSSMLRIDQPDGLTTEEYRKLRTLIPQFTEMCERLSAFKIPETLHHDDFHDGNIFIQDGRIILSDWGESCVAHPFFTMVVNLRSIAYRLNLEENEPEVLQVRDNYLKNWSQFGTPSQLLEAYGLANQIGMVVRALTWYRVLSNLDPVHRGENEDAVPGWLQEFINTAKDKE